MHSTPSSYLKTASKPSTSTHNSPTIKPSDPEITKVSAASQDGNENKTPLKSDSIKELKALSQELSSLTLPKPAP